MDCYAVPVPYQSVFDPVPTAPLHSAPCALCRLLCWTRHPGLAQLQHGPPHLDRDPARRRVVCGTCSRNLPIPVPDRGNDQGITPSQTSHRNGFEFRHHLKRDMSGTPLVACGSPLNRSVRFPLLIVLMCLVVSGCTAPKLAPRPPADALRARFGTMAVRAQPSASSFQYELPATKGVAAGRGAKAGAKSGLAVLTVPMSSGGAR